MYEEVGVLGGAALGPPPCSVRWRGHPSSRGARADSGESTDEMHSRTVSLQVQFRSKEDPTSHNWSSILAPWGRAMLLLYGPIPAPTTVCFYLDMEPLPPSGGVLGGENCRLLPPLPCWCPGGAPLQPTWRGHAGSTLLPEAHSLRDPTLGSWVSVLFPGASVLAPRALVLEGSVAGASPTPPQSAAC